MIIQTIEGEMDDSLLEKREGTVDNDDENTTWVEYWRDNTLMHRSAHVTLKRMPTFAGGETATIG